MAPVVHFFTEMQGWTPLQAAIAKGSEKPAMRLDTDVDHVQIGSEQGQYFQVVRLLVDAGASLSARQ